MDTMIKDAATEVLKIWASEKLDLPVEQIERVVIAFDEGYMYSEYTYEFGSCEVVAILNKADGLFRRTRRLTILDFEDKPEWDFAELLQDILGGEAGRI